MKPMLVLDIDETLVLAGCFSGSYAVRKRPWVDNFIKAMYKEYEIVLFTSSLASYAKSISWDLDPLQIRFANILSKEHMSWEVVNGQEEGFKDLSKVGRDLEKVIWIDDNKEYFRHSPEKGLEVPKFDGDEGDMVLKALEPLLRALATVHKRFGFGFKDALKNFYEKWGKNVGEFTKSWMQDIRDEDVKFDELVKMISSGMR